MPVISTNAAANMMVRYLNQNAGNQSSALAELASGSQISKASNNASGLAIGTQLESDVIVLSQASTNTTQASSMLQAAEGGLARISDILQRMKSLAAEGASGNVTDAQRSDDIDTEYQKLYTEIDSIASGTRYAGLSLLNNVGTVSTGLFSAGTVSFIVGTAAADSIAVNGSSFQVAASSLIVQGAGTTISSIASLANATKAIDALTTAINTITQDRVVIGAYETQLLFQGQAIATDSEDSQASASAMTDADVAQQKTMLSASDVLTQSAVAALTQADQMPSELLKLFG